MRRSSILGGECRGNGIRTIREPIVCRSAELESSLGQATKPRLRSSTARWSLGASGGVHVPSTAASFAVRPVPAFLSEFGPKRRPVDRPLSCGAALSARALLPPLHCVEVFSGAARGSPSTRREIYPDRSTGYPPLQLCFSCFCPGTAPPETISRANATVTGEGVGRSPFAEATLRMAPSQLDDARCIEAIGVADTLVPRNHCRNRRGRPSKQRKCLVLGRTRIRGALCCHPSPV